MDKEMLERVMLGIALVIASALLWVVFSIATQNLLGWAQYSRGIDLLYLPAGARLLIVLVFGIWGATGIAISNPLMAMFVFGPNAQPETFTNSFIAGFVPYLTVVAGCKLLGVDRDLAALRPIHLAVLALAVSIATPLAFNMQFMFDGLKPQEDLAANLSAMMLGDFLGCLLMLVLARLAIAIYRQAKVTFPQ